MINFRGLVKHLAITVVAIVAAQSAAAQYYTWGSDAPDLKWRRIKTDDVSVLYPDSIESIARRTLHYIDAARPSISYGYTHPALNIPFVMHPENMRSNGLVMWMPRRIEFITTPAVDGFSTPWLKQLVAHEYRHAVQYNNLNQGVIKALSYVLGQQGSTIGLLFMPLYAIEGDAVMSETQMTTFGRGRQPRFSIEYRALGRDIFNRKNVDKWYCGSYREFIPDHYQLGYQICSYTDTYYQENIWNKVVRYGARNPYMIFTTSIALKKFYDTGGHDLFNRSFNHLNDYWESLPQEQDSSTPITEMDADDYTTYSSPLPLNDTTAIVVVERLTKPTQFRKVDLRTGKSEHVCYTGSISSRPTLSEDRVVWSEYRRSTLFNQKIGSVLCYMDLDDPKPHTAKDFPKNLLYPTATTNDLLAWVEYDMNGCYSVVEQHSSGENSRYAPPYMSEIHSLAWDNATQKLYVIITDNSGMWIGRCDNDGTISPITKGSFTTLSRLTARDGVLYFGSISSGLDQIHSLDLASLVQKQLTTSRYGSFDPAATADSTLLLSCYSKRGYHLAKQQLSLSQGIVEWQPHPRDIVNPASRKWGVVNLDTVNFTHTDSLQSIATNKSKRYRKFPNLVNIHSWMPLEFDPEKLIDEKGIHCNWGATILSQNLLSNATGSLSYGWNKSEGSIVKGSFNYNGLGVDLGINATYGGDQLIYSIATADPASDGLIEQPRPVAKNYFSVGMDATLPLVFQRGYHTRQLSLMTGWNYSNGMVANISQIETNSDGYITNIDKIGYDRGLHKLSFGIGYSDYVRGSYRDVSSPWGYTAIASYALNPTNSDFSSLVSLYGSVATPGFAPFNSLTLAVEHNSSIGGWAQQGAHPMLGYKSIRLLPQGYTSAEITNNNYWGARMNYQLPLCYPEGGIGSILYFKRIRMNLGATYNQFELSQKGNTHRIYSYGADFMFDLNIFRQPAPATSTLTLSIYKPSDKRGVWFGGGISLPL